MIRPVCSTRAQSTWTTRLPAEATTKTARIKATPKSSMAGWCRRPSKVQSENESSKTTRSLNQMNRIMATCDYTKLQPSSLRRSTNTANLTSSRRQKFLLILVKWQILFQASMASVLLKLTKLSDLAIRLERFQYQTKETMPINTMMISNQRMQTQLTSWARITKKTTLILKLNRNSF